MVVLWVTATCRSPVNNATLRILACGVPIWLLQNAISFFVRFLENYALFLFCLALMQHNKANFILQRGL